MTNRLLLAMVLAGSLVGAVAGRVRYTRLDDHRPLCATCHHGTMDLVAFERPPPHSIDFDAECHACHVLPVKQYLGFVASRVGLDAPDFVGAMQNPTIGGQTCMECHLGRLRGSLGCERCHVDGTTEVRLDVRCEVCHDTRIPLHPHTERKCRDCHGDVFIYGEDRDQMLMREKLGGRPLRPREAP